MEPPIQGFSVLELIVATRDGQNFRLLERFSYTRKDGVVVDVEAGATSNGASSPRLLWRAIPPFGKYWMAAFLHDDMYDKGKYPKEFCDETFLEAMEFLGVGEIEDRFMYEGVDKLGWKAFHDCREEDNGEKQSGTDRTDNPIRFDVETLGIETV